VAQTGAHFSSQKIELTVGASVLRKKKIKKKNGDMEGKI